MMMCQEERTTLMKTLQEAEVLRPGVKSPPMDEQARKDLEEDIARMEMELAKAQERIESAQVR